MSRLENVRWVNLPSQKDSRGTLTSIEGNRDMPFTIKRVFYMHHIIADRGGHAHIDTDQVVIASFGSFKMDLCDGIKTRTFEMNDATKGVYVPRMIFIKMYNFSNGAVCLVLASTHYDISKSIRIWEDYVRLKTGLK